MEFKHLRLLTGYPKEIVSLGDHIRAERLTRGEPLKDVANQIGVAIETVINWESNCTAPRVSHYPKIMEYLSYCPVQYPKTLGERLRLHREFRGLSVQALADQFCVDPSTVLAWERDERDKKRHRDSWLRISKIFDFEWHRAKPET